MNFVRKNTNLKILFVFLITTISVFSLFYNKIISRNQNIITNCFIKFMESYKSKELDIANTYILNEELPNINDIFLKAINRHSSSSQSEIISTLQNMIYLINYEILSSKTFFNKSNVKVNLNYYDTSKFIINFFKTEEPFERNYSNFIEFIKSEKCKISTDITIKMVKKNERWYIILSEKLINILTSGLYKSFVI